MDGPKRKELIVKDQPAGCQACPDYDTCTEMCEDVELWVDQDFIGRNSKIALQNKGNSSPGNPNYSGRRSYGHEPRFDDFVDLCKFYNPDTVKRDSDISQDAWNEVSGMRLSDKITRFIYSYYMLGKRIRDIAIDEGATSQAIDQRHIQAKKSIRRHLEMRSCWPDIRDTLSYKDIRAYDMARLFYFDAYPRKIIAKVMKVHVSIVMKSIGG